MHPSMSDVTASSKSFVMNVRLLINGNVETERKRADLDENEDFLGSLIS